MSAHATPRHWAHIGESTFVAGMWLLYWVHRWLGRWPFRVCVYPVVAWYWATRPQARRASREYLERVQAAHNALGHAPTWRDGLRHFFRFAEVILDKTLAMSGRYRFDTVRFVGREPLLAMRRSGRGALVVTAHVGCVEMCQATAQREAGLQLNILVHTRHAEQFNRVLRRLDPDSPVQLLQVTDVNAATAVLLADKVAQGEFVAMAGDRVPVMASKTTAAQFLGHEAPFPVGPYVLAALLKCPLYLMACVHDGKGHVVHFQPLAEHVVLPRADRDAALARYASDYANALSELLRDAPFDWFNFFPFWDQGRASVSVPTSSRCP